MFADRKLLYKKLGEEFDGVVLSYITSDRPGFETQIAQDVIDLFIDQLDKIGVVKRIILYLYTRGGDTAAAWNIVNLLRMYCDDLIVIVPHKAHSAGTMICLGANTIVMTKQATLGPIDPSLNTPLNPRIPNTNNTMPVSVEAVKGYIEFAKDEMKIKTGTSLSNIMIKLSDNLHPLVLGQVYRSRAQIKMLAQKLLKHQVKGRKSVHKIIEFLCSESGSHDYTINRREAKKDLSLNVIKPSDEQYETIKQIYDNISDELEFGKVFDPNKINGTYTVRRGLIESICGGSDYFATEGVILRGVLSNGQQGLNNQIVFEGWRHDDPNVNSKIVTVVGKGDVKIEKDDNFCL